MITRTLILGCLLVVAPARLSGQLPVLQDSAGNRLNAWTARANNGRAFMGTWTAVADTSGRTVRGTWTLIDKQGRMLASGTWSAAKSENEWNGSWRATVDQHAGDYGGTWSARMSSTASVPLAAMFEKALSAAVDGSWWFGPYNGTWAVRAYEWKSPEQK